MNQMHLPGRRFLKETDVREKRYFAVNFAGLAVLALLGVMLSSLGSYAQEPDTSESGASSMPITTRDLRAADMFLFINSTDVVELQLYIPADSRSPDSLANEKGLTDALDGAFRHRLRSISVDKADSADYPTGGWIVSALLPNSSSATTAQFVGAIALRPFVRSLYNRDIDVLSVSIAGRKGVPMTGIPTPVQLDEPRHLRRCYWSVPVDYVHEPVDSIYFQVGLDGEELDRRQILLLSVILLGVATPFVRSYCALRTRARNSDRLQYAWFSLSRFSERLPFYFSMLWLSALLYAAPVNVLRLVLGTKHLYPVVIALTCAYLLGLLVIQIASWVACFGALIKLGGIRIPAADSLAIRLASLLSSYVPFSLCIVLMAAVSDNAWRPFGVATLLAISSIVLGRTTVLKVYAFSVEPVDEGDLYDNAVRIVGAAGRTLSSLRVVYSPRYPMANAFAIGVTTIQVTEDLAKLLSRDEMNAVLAHEAAHLHHNHSYGQRVLLVVCLGIFFGILTPLFTNPYAQWAFLAPFVGIPLLLLHTAVSRKHEVIADAESARITKDPTHLATALTHIYSANRVPAEFGRWLTLTCTHPSLVDRCTRLNAMANASAPKFESEIGTYPLPAFTGNSAPIFDWTAKSYIAANRHILQALSITLIPSLVGWLAAESNIAGAPLAMVLIIGTVMAYEFYTYIYDRSGTAAFRRMRARLQARLAVQGVTTGNAVFVGFSSQASNGAITEANYSDIGFVNVDGGMLSFNGERHRFTLRANQIQALQLEVSTSAPRRQSSVQVRWLADDYDPDDNGVFTFTPVAASSVRLANTETERWLNALHGWLGEQKRIQGDAPSTGTDEDQDRTLQRSTATSMPPKTTPAPQSAKPGKLRLFLRHMAYLEFMALCFSSAFGLYQNGVMSVITLYPLVIALFGAALISSHAPP